MNGLSLFYKYLFLTIIYGFTLVMLISFAARPQLLISYVQMFLNETYIRVTASICIVLIFILVILNIVADLPDCLRKANNNEYEEILDL